MNIHQLGEDIFVTAGGYKYAQGGEGAAWLKIPANCELRPRITGWFADFDSLKEKEYPYPVRYGNAGERFLGATRDISGLFRQTAVFKFMNRMGMSVDCLEENNLLQTAYLISLFDNYGIAESDVSLISSRNDKERGPFLTLDIGTSEKAYDVHKKLWNEYKILTDTRGKGLRIGPAPYTTEQEMNFAMEMLKKILTS
jgi:selenocysteine lyase/cysteine desulfurase